MQSNNFSSSSSSLSSYYYFFFLFYLIRWFSLALIFLWLPSHRLAYFWIILKYKIFILRFDSLKYKRYFMFNLIILVCSFLFFLINILLFMYACQLWEKIRIWPNYHFMLSILHYYIISTLKILDRYHLSSISLFLELGPKGHCDPLNVHSD